MLLRYAPCPKNGFQTELNPDVLRERSKYHARYTRTVRVGGGRIYIYIKRQEQTKTKKRKKTEIIAARGGVRALPLRTRLVHNYAVL